MGVGQGPRGDHLTVPTRSAATTALDVFQRYESIRSRLPRMPLMRETRVARGLLDIAADFDLFIFDAFGVIVLGDTPIAGAPSVLRDLKAAGKSICILTNAASHDRRTQLAKYSGLGFPVAEHEVVSSRSVLLAALRAWPQVSHWAAILPSGARLDDLPEGTVTQDDPDRFWSAGGYLFLSASGWTTGLQDKLADRLEARPVPVLVGNPDLVAPREHGLSIEPGHFAHDLIDRTGCEVRFFGKPYANAFDAAIAAAAAGQGPVDRSRVAMVGDTLHTDILGGAGAGLRTVLVTDHGVLKGCDIAALIAESGIHPDFIVPSI